jgi:formylmethanofuran dehydrogenase subunit E
MTEAERRELEARVEEAGRFHGHVCGGIASGARMALEGMRRLGISDPKGRDRKRLVVFTEMDRCPTDAIMVTTGCTPGKRSLKILDHGKMAATFVDLESGRAVRLRSLPWTEPVPGESPIDRAAGPIETLFTVTEVKVTLRPEDLPGPPVRRACCARCGEEVIDGREVALADETLCQPCASGKSYFLPAGAR